MHRQSTSLACPASTQTSKQTTWAAYASTFFDAKSNVESEVAAHREYSTAPDLSDIRKKPITRSSARRYIGLISSVAGAALSVAICSYCRPEKMEDI